MAAVLNYTTVPFTSINMKTSVKQSKSQIFVLLYAVLKSPKPTQNSGVLCLTFLYPREFSQLSLKQFLLSWLLILKLNLCSIQRSSPQLEAQTMHRSIPIWQDTSASHLGTGRQSPPQVNFGIKK